MVVRRLIFEVCANCGNKIVDDEVAVLVDEHNDLLFCNDPCVHEYFENEINSFEVEHLKARSPQDIPVKDFSKYEKFLGMVLSEPDEIWEDFTEPSESPVGIYIGEFFHENEHIYYIAVAYRHDEKPSFVYMHFPTHDLKLVEKYRRGELIYDDAREAEIQLDDDEVTESNIAIDLYNEMLENRSEVDIDPEDFGSYSELKLVTVERPDEIWRRIDDSGNTFIIYISHQKTDRHLQGDTARHGPQGAESETFAYVVVAVEDEIVGGAIPVFGFPTLDQKLLDRFRVGELIKREGDDF